VFVGWRFFIWTMLRPVGVIEANGLNDRFNGRLVIQAPGLNYPMRSERLTKPLDIPPTDERAGNRKIGMQLTWTFAGTACQPSSQDSAIIDARTAAFW